MLHDSAKFTPLHSFGNDEGGIWGPFGLKRKTVRLSLEEQGQRQVKVDELWSVVFGCHRMFNFFYASTIVDFSKEFKELLAKLIEENPTWSKALTEHLIEFMLGHESQLDIDEPIAAKFFRIGWRLVEWHIYQLKILGITLDDLNANQPIVIFYNQFYRYQSQSNAPHFPLHTQTNHWQYSFYQVADSSALISLNQDIYTQLEYDPTTQMAALGYDLIEDGTTRPQDYVIYGSIIHGRWRSMHSGVVDDDFKVLSQVANCSMSWKHAIDNVASFYGDKTMVFRHREPIVSLFQHYSTSIDRKFNTTTEKEAYLQNSYLALERSWPGCKRVQTDLLWAKGLRDQKLREILVDSPQANGNLDPLEESLRALKLEEIAQDGPEGDAVAKTLACLGFKV